MQVMGKRDEEIKAFLLIKFPKLAQDKNFKITSKASNDYNCIAWACKYDDRWIQPPYLGKPNLDCVVWWPPEVQEGSDVCCLISVFENQGYMICDTFEHEDGYIKVALYADANKNRWTHAARERRNGNWTSKLGPSVDIQHGTPYTIESEIYGKVYCFMKKEFE